MANDIFNYCVATNTGKGFITHDDSHKIWFSGQPADVWVVTDTFESRLWIARNQGVTKTKAEAQALVTTAVEADQAAWDADEKEAGLHAPEGKGNRPGNITLP